MIGLSIRSALRRIHILSGEEPVPSEPKLRYSPPALTSPTTLTPNSTAFQQLTLSDGQDYIIQMPSSVKDGGLQINGGRNIHIIGGAIQVGPSPASDAQRRAIYLNGPTGTVHLEGVHILNTHNQYYDAIVVNGVSNNPNVIIQIVNCRIENIRGISSGWHGDAFQIIPVSSVFTGEVRVDRLTVSTNYQSIYIPHDGSGWHRFSRMNTTSIVGETPSAASYWFGDNTGDTVWGMKNVELEDVYVTARSGDFEQEFRPNTGATIVENRPVISSGVATWPNAQNFKILGELRLGDPPDGDFVKAEDVGLDYVSPGYEE
jgi:hypothetical protein